MYIDSLRIKTGAILCTCFLMIFIWGCKSGSGRRIYQEAQIQMGTLAEIKLVAADEKSAGTAFEAVFSEVERIEKIASFQLSNSELGCINRAAGKGPVSVSPELLQIIQQATYYSGLTEGAFDITIGPLTKLWGFDTQNYQLPDPDEIQRRLTLLDYRAVIIKLKPPEVKLAKAGMSIDLGAIAKGYAVDRAVTVLKQYGISDAIVNLGGDIMAIGRKPDGRAWKIGIQHPREKERVLASLKINNQAVVTSGDYERFFFVQGERYHHILKPQTGWPAKECQSVTVIAQEALAADALATGVFILGPKKGLALIEGLKETEALIVNAAGEVSISSGLKDKLDFNQ
jgi:thiamine biosynthesis lipoprotein